MNAFWWFIAALALFALEIIVPGFVIMWFGVGALAAALLDLLGVHDLIWQVIVFAIVSLIGVGMSRTLFKNFFMRRSPGSKLKTNADALIDKNGVVTEQIDNSLSKGRIYVEGQDWSARSENGEIIEPDTKVRIIKYEGVRLYVEKI
jgi:membrane protein implicated in regulation of membrane protease activity